MAILGSTFTLLIAAGAVASLFIALPEPKPPNSQSLMTNVILVFAAITSAGAIWFLVRNRAAFVPAENRFIG